ncbi:hypothetical protein OKW38_000656 [Paraburkholderia sp. MM5496-R1]|uniref:Uncharacterized protein n=1 Tax=Paraburkholderia tuberum TaxID=157910 RepID=A0A1H1KCX9_9BURK|nr:hypothetical protein SAMN05445850_6932 [Paraburkholderia tuberum]
MLTLVFSHVADDTLYVVVSCYTENLFSAPIGAQHPGCKSRR